MKIKKIQPDFICPATGPVWLERKDSQMECCEKCGSNTDYYAIIPKSGAIVCMDCYQEYIESIIDLIDIAMGGTANDR